MARMAELSREEMSNEQRRVHDKIVARLGVLIAPYVPMLRSPKLTNTINNLANFVRSESSLSPRQTELAVLVTARTWTARYVWSAHASLARKAGLDQGLIAAIAERQKPDFAQADEEAVYQFSTELHEKHVVSDSTYKNTLKQLGEQGVVDLVGLLGHYTLISMTVTAFEVLPPEETKDVLPD